MIRSIFLALAATVSATQIPPFESWGFDARYETVERNRNGYQVFVETGTAGGGGVFMALYAGFREIYSTEVNQELYALAVRRVGDLPNIHLHFGDSGVMLEKKILRMVKEPALFWLDAHSWPIDPRGENCPILRELKAIAAHPIKTHTILIDDIRLFGTEAFDFIEIEELVQAIKAINPNYTITFEEGYQERDVLVARVP